MRTGDIALKLRTWAETIRNKSSDRYNLLCTAADRLDELDERIAIMTEHEYKPEQNNAWTLTFPPGDDELRR